jgi:hypothetical protein
MVSTGEKPSVTMRIDLGHALMDGPNTGTVVDEITGAKCRKFLPPRHLAIAGAMDSRRVDELPELHTG